MVSVKFVKSGLSEYRCKLAWVLNVCMDIAVGLLLAFTLYNARIGKLFIGQNMKFYLLVNFGYAIYAYEMYRAWPFNKAKLGFQPFCDRIIKCILMFAVEVLGFMVW